MIYLNSCNTILENYIYFYKLTCYFIIDKLCSLYYAHVSRHYDPTTSSISNTVATLNFKCSSSWYFSNEITGEIQSSISSPLAPNPRPAERSISGYYAVGGENVFGGGVHNKPWVEFDFGKVVQIQKVIVKARNSTTSAPKFENVEVRIGNASSPTGDFSASILLAHFANAANAGEVVVFEGLNPIWGRYVTIQRIDAESTAFVIANVNILGEG